MFLPHIYTYWVSSCIVLFELPTFVVVFQLSVAKNIHVWQMLEVTRYKGTCSNLTRRFIKVQLLWSRYRCWVIGNPQTFVTHLKNKRTVLCVFLLPAIAECISLTVNKSRVYFFRWSRGKMYRTFYNQKKKKSQFLLCCYFSSVSDGLNPLKNELR